MSDLRAEYEAWIDTLTYDQLAMLDETSAWEGWQASRAALKVELPDSVWSNSFEDCVCSVDDIKQMLDKAGISYA